MGQTSGQGAPSFSAPFAEKGGKAMALFPCRINKAFSRAVRHELNLTGTVIML
jgi:hypothetical protein